MHTITIPMTDHIAQFLIEQGHHLGDDERAQLLAGLELIEAQRIKMLRIVARFQGRAHNKAERQG